MREDVQIRILGAAVGRFPQVLSLNPAFRPELNRLKLTLDIDSRLADPQTTLLDVEEELLLVCPSLQWHQCRGPHEYRLFESQAAARAAPPIEANLALAHLIEHVMIDTIAFVTDAESVSGITGAHTNSDYRFDIFVECPDESVLALAGYVGITWIASLLRGEGVNEVSHAALALARFLYWHQPRAVSVRCAAQHLQSAPEEILRAFSWLRAIGWAHEVPHTINFSGLSAFTHITSPNGWRGLPAMN